MAKLRNPLRLIRRQEVSRKFLAVFTALSLIFQNGALFFSPTFASNTAPDEVEGLTHWFNQDGLEYDDNELISEWTDLSPSGDNAEQGTESLQPIYKADQINGLAAVQFTDALGMYLQHTNVIGCSFHLFIVHKNTANNFPLYGGSIYAYDISFDKWDNRKLLVTEGAEEAINNPISETFTKDTGDWIISEVSSINTDLTRFYEDGTTRGTDDAVQCLNFMVNRIGQDVYETAAGGGLIAEIVQYGAPLSAEDRQGVVGWLGDKYGIDVPSYCGDGTTDPGEQCDDGNTQSGDGCSATCQTELGTITVLKEVINDNGGDAGVNDFGLTIGGTLVTSGQVLAVDANEDIALDEAGLAGYSFVSISGDEGCPSVLGGTVNLDEGENITCTITNNDIAPTLKLVKVVTNNNGGNKTAADWTLYATGDGGFNDLGNSTTFHSVKAGVVYTLSESLVTGYDTGSWSCDGGSLSGDQLTLSLNQNVTCTITNTAYGSIGDFIWTDTDGDKVQDVGEAGIAGVTVNLYRDDGDGNFEPTGDDASASPLATTITDASGWYLFSGLVMGNYWVDVDESTLPAGLVITTANDPLLVSLGTGADERGADFGYKKKGAVLGEKTVLAATGTSPSVLVFDLVMLGIGILLRVYSRRLRRVPAGTRLRRRSANA